MQEADTATEWDAACVRRFLSYSPPAAPDGATLAAVGGSLDQEIEPLIAALAPSDLAGLKTLFASNSQVPQAHDRLLLRAGRIYFGQTTLTGAERTELRAAFVRLVLTR